MSISISELLLGGIALIVILLILAVVLLVALLRRPVGQANPPPQVNATVVNGDNEAFPRQLIAKQVIWIAGIGLLVVSIVVIAVAWLANAKPDVAGNMVFNALVPLLGTWVGTVIAFYFSSANYQAATQNVKDLYKQLTPDQRLASTAVTSAMIRRADMEVIQLTPGANENNMDAAGNFPLQRLIDMLHGDQGEQPVSRIPILDRSDVVLYVLHESVIYEYAAVAGPPPPADRSLRTFLDDQDRRDFVTNTKAFVAVSGTLADAKAAMDKVKSCQDVFVTQSGQPTEPVLGWLTNVTILDKAKT